MRTTLFNPISTTTTTDTTSTSHKTPDTQSTLSFQMQLRAALNRQIAYASVNAMRDTTLSNTFGLFSEDKPNTLMFQSSMDGIYAALTRQLQSKIMPIYQLSTYQIPSVSVDDYALGTSEHTANTILRYSLGFFSRYSDQYPDMEKPDIATKFIDIIRGGFEDGYGKAVNILSAMNVFEGNVKTDIEKTYALVMNGYDEFLAARTPDTESVTETIQTENTVSDTI